MNQIIADGIEEVSVIGGIVRVDLFAYTPGPKGADGRPPREHVTRLCLPPEAFVQTYASLHQVVQQLREKGLLQSRAELGTPAEGVTPADAAGRAPAVERARGSANF